MGSTTLKVVAGALIPSLATLVFNLMNFFFDNYEKHPMPRVEASSFDIGAGCVFAMLGICVSVNDHARSSRLMVICVVLILALLFGDMLLPAFLGLNKYYMVAVLDAVSFCVLGWSIKEAG